MSKPRDALFDTDDRIKSRNGRSAQDDDNGHVSQESAIARSTSDHGTSGTCDDEPYLQEPPAGSLTDRSPPESKAPEGVAYSDDISQISDDGMSVSSCASGFVPFSPVRPISGILYSYPSPSVVLSKFECLPISGRSLVASPSPSPSLSPRRVERSTAEHSSSLLSVGESCPSATSSPLPSDYNERSPSLFADGFSPMTDGPLEQSNGIPMVSHSDRAVKIADQLGQREDLVIEGHGQQGEPIDSDANAGCLGSVSAEEDSLSPVHPAKRPVGSHPGHASADRAPNNSPASSTSSVGTTSFGNWTAFRQLPERIGGSPLPDQCLARDSKCQCEPLLSRSSVRGNASKRDSHPSDGKNRLPVDESRRLRIYTSEMRIRQCGGAICRQAPTSASSSEDEGLVATVLLDTIKQLRKEKENLANQYEREEEYLTNDLTKKLNRLREEKDELERTLEKQQEGVVNKLLVKISKLERDIKLKQEALDAMRRERVDLENTLEQEQEALVNKLWKRMEKLEMEKRHLQDRLRRSDTHHPEQQERAVEAADSSSQVNLLTPCRTTHSSTQTAPDNDVDELQKQVVLLRAEVATLRKQIECYEDRCGTAPDGLADASKVSPIIESARLKRKLNGVGKTANYNGSRISRNEHIQGVSAAGQQFRGIEIMNFGSSDDLSGPVEATDKRVLAGVFDEQCGDLTDIGETEANEARDVIVVGPEKARHDPDHENDGTSDANIL